MYHTVWYCLSVLRNRETASDLLLCRKRTDVRSKAPYHTFTTNVCPYHAMGLTCCYVSRTTLVERLFAFERVD